jgi:hypothetical protein
MAPLDRRTSHWYYNNMSASCLYWISPINGRRGAQESKAYGYWDDVARACQYRCSGNTHEQRAVQNRMKHTDATYPAVEPREHLSVYVEQIGGKAKAHTGA